MRRATRDIVVYKTLEVRNARNTLLFSPIYKFAWLLGEIYVAKEKINNNSQTLRITKGVFHSFSNIKEARTVANVFTSRKTFKAIIPKGTYYMRGKHGEIVSKYLKIVKRA